MDRQASLLECTVQSITKMEIADEVPWSEDFSAYDEAQFALYMRVLTATQTFTPEDEICSAILGIDPTKEPERARKCLGSHLKRAIWLTNDGLHLIFPDKCPRCGRVHTGRQESNLR
jgi:hypothetical protein